MPTPLCDALRTFAARNGLRMHMPGHKGKTLPMEELDAIAAIDYTELSPTGDLFAGGGAIGAAEELWAEYTGMEQCLFLTGGSTQGIHTALALTCAPGEGLIMDRGSHRSVYHAAALLDLTPHYLTRPWLSRAGVYGPMEPEEVAKTMDAHPEAKTVCITSPTYYGVCSDIPSIAREVHRRGGKLVVDDAHGAHLFFLGDKSAAAADLLVTSAHKTLPALGQTALLLCNGMEHRELRRTASLYGSSSPSYPMMASLDAARDYLLGKGGEDYRSTARRVAELRETFPFPVPESVRLDPCRLTLLCGDGFTASRRLEELGVWPEMADKHHVVLILTCMDGAEDLSRLETALADLGDLLLPPEQGVENLTAPEPVTCLSLRKAWFSPRRRLPLKDGEGKVAACQIAPYPPGIPVIAPGEQVTKKALAYLYKVGYNMEQEVEVVAELP